MIKGLNRYRCGCGGRPQFITTSFGWGAVGCDTCGIHTKPRNADWNNYNRDIKRDWKLAFPLKKKELK